MENIFRASNFPDQPEPYHDKAEILAALDALAENDIQRIVDIAVFRILGTRGQASEDEAKDLFNEAVAKTLSFERKWGSSQRMSEIVR